MRRATKVTHGREKERNNNCNVQNKISVSLTTLSTASEGKDTNRDQVVTRCGRHSNRVQTRLDRFFSRKTVAVNCNLDFTILMVDGNGKMNKWVAIKIERCITGKRPGSQVVHKHSAKIQQTDDHNCGPILLFNIENITQSKRPDAFDVHIPTKAAICL